MFIQCTGQAAFGGRTSDIFYIENINNLDELNDYMQTKQPLKCKAPNAYYLWTIAAKDKMGDRLIYLNNYLKINKVNYYLKDKEERQYIYDNVCKGCTMSDGSLSNTLRCRYDDDGNGNCLNYEEPFSLVKWFKSKF